MARPKTGGRKRGTPNKATADVKALAQEYGEEAVTTLAELMRSSASDKARASAAIELLNRGYGKPAQAIIGGGENDPAIRVITEIRRSIVDPRHKDR